MSVKMWFTMSLEAGDMFARSEEVEVIGKPDGQVIETVVSAGARHVPGRRHLPLRAARVRQAVRAKVRRIEMRLT